MLFEALRPLQIATRIAGRGRRSRPTCWRATSDRRARASSDRGARRHAGARGRVRALAAGLAIQRALRRPDHLHRGRPARRWRERKRAALARMGSLGERHRVVELDALVDDGPAQPRRGRGAAERLRRPRDHHRRAAWLSRQPKPSTASGGGSRRSCPGSRMGTTSPTCTSAARSRAHVRLFRTAALGVRARAGVPALREQRGRDGLARGCRLQVGPYSIALPSSLRRSGDPGASLCI